MASTATLHHLPPGLTGGTDSSKASTSSIQSIPSVLSSFQLDDCSILNGMNDMEDIGLDDDIDNERGRTSDRSGQRGSMAPLRDLTHGQAKRPPNLNNRTISTIDPRPTSLLTAPGKSSRSKKSQSTPPLNRSSSQGPPQSRLSIALNNANGFSNGHQPRVSPRGPKRMSFQRKTSDQLEEEYDSDDEIPDDAVFYNVPISPRSSRALSTATSAATSAATSPERESNGEPNALNPAPDSRERAEIAINGVKMERDDSELRSKTWSHAMMDLSEEAKELSEKLEKHAEVAMDDTEKRLQRRVSTVVALKKKKSDSVHAIELPPLQVSNGMIDPLPISKEKEAVLSRTRPSWLPPKSKEEEKRHLKEYQKMMRRSQENERKRVQKVQQTQEAKDKLHVEFSNVWETKIIPNWTQACRSSDTRELWWKGVAPRCRGQVWSLSFGNHLAVSAETFKLALKRAKEIEIGLKKAPTMYTPRERELFVAIHRDVKVTFPELKIFQENGPLYESLLDVLMAYSMYRSDVGYIYGTHAVAGTLLLNQSPEQAFVTLANMLNRPLPLAFFTQDDGAISRSYNLFLKAFQYKLPSLYRHIHNNLRIDPTLYLEPMFLTLFALHCPVDITSRIWDVYSFEGDSFLVRTAVGILTVLESKLYGSRNEVLDILGWNAGLFPLGSDDDFMAVVRSAGKEEAEKDYE